jgi:protein-tyrosine phosphatase
MKKIMFVCHGNICRSPMAEFLMKDLVKKNNCEDDFLICSSATSSEELGNPVHYGTKAVLDRLGISCKGKYAVKLTASDYNKYDYFIGMDEYNRRNMLRIFGSDPQNKISCLLDYTDNPREVADPWYTGNFNLTFNDITEGLNAFYDFIKSK